MPRIRPERVSELQPLLEMLNGQYGWVQLKETFLRYYFTGVQLRNHRNEVIDWPADEEFKKAADLLRTTLRAWADEWIESLTNRGSQPLDPDVYLRKHAKLYKEFRKFLDELPKEAVVAMFLDRPPLQQLSIATGEAVPAEGPQRDPNLRIDIPGASRNWEDVDIDLLPTGARPTTAAGNLGTPQGRESVEGLLAATQIKDPILMAKAIAVEQFRILMRSRILLGRCGLSGCDRYFLNLSCKTQYCSHKHAQTVTSKRRGKASDKALPKVLKAIAAYERRSHSAQLDWKRWVARHARTNRYVVTVLVNAGKVQPPRLTKVNKKGEGGRA